jgi:hypothetical protein
MLKIKVHETVEISPENSPVKVGPVSKVSETLSAISEVCVISNSNDGDRKYPECGILILFLTQADRPGRLHFLQPPRKFQVIQK